MSSPLLPFPLPSQPALSCFVVCRYGSFQSVSLPQDSSNRAVLNNSARFPDAIKPNPALLPNKNGFLSISTSNRRQKWREEVDTSGRNGYLTAVGIPSSIEDEGWNGESDLLGLMEELPESLSKATH